MPVRVLLCRLPLKINPSPLLWPSGPPGAEDDESDDLVDELLMGLATGVAYLALGISWAWMPI